MSADRKVRPFYWSVRRELWEHPAIYLAPAGAAAVGLLGFLVSTLWLARSVAGAVPKNDGLMMPYVFTALAVMVIGFLVSIFYALGALNGERRDRSIQFWKSLPVSDLTTVLAKAAVPLLVLPVVLLAVIIGAQLIMLVLSTIVVLLHGVDPGRLWARVDMRLMWTVLPYGLFINALWLAPVYAWLLLISGWAKRMTFVWALAPPLAVALFERLAFNSSHFIHFLIERLLGGFGEAFSVRGEGRAAIDKFSDIDPIHAFSSPHIWGGLAVAGLLLAVTIRLRRSRDPI
ncbi:MAG: ABC-2 transporter permease [Alphaproteobacteria bacterium]|nr:ABC-2 transporter permease [Alphaproteobacteria bacterium]MBU1513182.1 ABC-2 transporter permease [Alphaproteobacteria bacterium]MBU2095290.1 ABC-2 transporter permease [Alphaproteobacteria bacterium]MBU2152205.1 ABC-2 transporter permease [Alphaproteobacteria bacterium]MBU2306748.1 ABC-2 transporter permease [Alphaproteobacteria bacterium]